MNSDNLFFKNFSTGNDEILENYRVVQFPDKSFGITDGGLIIFFEDDVDQMLFALDYELSLMDTYSFGASYKPKGFNEIDSLIERIQNDLFDLGADLCLPESQNENLAYEPLRVRTEQVSRLEAEIDTMNKNIEPIRSFVLPGGTEIAANFHLCRTICRRAERRVVKLMETETINLEALIYLNRLSDWFFCCC